MNLSVTVVIPTRNRVRELKDCLTSVLSQSHLPDEVIIVDSSENNHTRELVEEMKKDMKISLKYIFTSPGLVHQKKVGVENSKGEIIFFLDDDVILDKDFVKEIMRVFQAHYPNIGGVMGNNLNARRIPRWSLRYLIRQIFFLNNSGNGKFRLSGFQTSVVGLSGIRRTDALAGGYTAYTKEAIEKVGLDEKIFFYPEDMDLAWRVSRKYPNYYTSYAKCWHLASPHSKLWNRREKIAVMENGFTYFFFKNFPRTPVRVFAYAMAMAGIKLRIMEMGERELWLLMTGVFFLIHLIKRFFHEQEKRHELS